MSRVLVNMSNGSYGKYNIGKHSYGSIEIDGDYLLDEFTVGNFCSIGPNVSLNVKGWSHNPEWITTYPFEAFPNKWSNVKNIKKYPRTKRTLKIGNDVWIGRDTLILSGVEIGDGAVIGANCVVSKDVPPYTIAVGNSIRFVKTRFSDEDIEFLLNLKWWDWSDDKINEHLTIINSGCISDLKKIT
jgi:acetyltransferase-like isoleucine patch superfamily enzyme